MSTEMQTIKPSQLENRKSLENSYNSPSATKPVEAKNQKLQVGQNNIVSLESKTRTTNLISKAIELKVKSGQDPIEATIHVLSSFKNKIDAFPARAKTELLERIQIEQKLDISSQEILAQQIDPTIASKNGIPENNLTQSEYLENKSKFPKIWDGKVTSLQEQINQFKTDEFNTEMAFSGIELSQLQFQNQIADVLLINNQMNLELSKMNGENMNVVIPMVKKMVMKNILREPIQEVYQNYLKTGKKAIDSYLKETTKGDPNSKIYANLIEKSMKLSGDFELILNNIANQLTLRNLFNS